MYTLLKAKEEIDAVAKHATDIAVHTLAIADNFDAKLESLKKEIAQVIETKFDELSKTFFGDTRNIETSAVADLGAKVAQLIHGAAPPAIHGVIITDTGAPDPQNGDHEHHLDSDHASPAVDSEIITETAASDSQDGDHEHQLDANHASPAVDGAIITETSAPDLQNGVHEHQLDCHQIQPDINHNTL
jgi:hypothetical protein